jgi:hypothetical protein
MTKCGDGAVFRLGFDMRPRKCVRSIDLMTNYTNDGLLSYEPGSESRSFQDLPVHRPIHSGTAKSSVSLPKPLYSPQTEAPLDDLDAGSGSVLLEFYQDTGARKYRRCPSTALTRANHRSYKTRPRSRTCRSPISICHRYSKQTAGPATGRAELY